MIKVVGVLGMVLIFIFVGLFAQMLQKYRVRKRKIFLFAALSFLFLALQQFFLVVWVFDSLFRGIPLLSYPLELLGIITCFSLSLLGMCMLGKVEP